MTTEEMEFDPTAVQQIDPSSVETTGPTYPTIQWHYGNPKLKKAGGMEYQGGWFIKADQIDAELLTAAGWTAITWSHDNGAEEDGFWRRELAVAVIAQRQRWEVIDDTTRKVFPWKNYDAAKAAGKASGRTHALVLVKGLEDVGPMILTLKGMAALGFTGSTKSGGALTTFSQTVITAANKASEAAAKKNGQHGANRWPWRAFWLPVGADREANGEPHFTEVGRGNATTRVVLPVALGLPAKPEGVQLNRFYIGNALLTVVNELYDEAEAGWTHAWDALQNPDGDPILPGAAVDNGAPTETAVDNTLEALGL